MAHAISWPQEVTAHPSIHAAGTRGEQQLLGFTAILISPQRVLAEKIGAAAAGDRRFPAEGLCGRVAEPAERRAGWRGRLWAVG